MKTHSFKDWMIAVRPWSFPASANAGLSVLDEGRYKLGERYMGFVEHRRFPCGRKHLERLFRL